MSQNIPDCICNTDSKIKKKIKNFKKQHLVKKFQQIKKNKYLDANPRLPPKKDSLNYKQGH